MGFASFGTNGGHNGSAGFDFFLNQPEVLNDFGWRAIHVEAEVGKQIISQYYNRSVDRSYYTGCSSGGRQGISTALNFPRDFDGILVGAPGVNWIWTVSSKGLLARRSRWPDIDSPGYVAEQQWKAIIEEQIRRFDPLDGVTDGIIDDPTAFKFDPEVLACSTDSKIDESLCLNPDQVASVRSVYQPITDTQSKLVFPSFELGSDTGVFSANQVNGVPHLAYSILRDFYRGAVYNDSSWNDLDFGLSDVETALEINPGRINTFEADMSGFQAGGGKLMVYHGRNDEAVTSALSQWYFNHVQQTLNFTLDQMLSFYRIFFIPGMHHCGGGPGAWSMGQPQHPLNPKKNNTAHNALLALVDWVERGNPPSSLIGTKYRDDDISARVLAERTHCVYPNVSKWDGTSDTAQASSWQCHGPKKLV